MLESFIAANSFERQNLGGTNAVVITMVLCTIKASDWISVSLDFVIYSKIPLLRPPKTKTLYLLKT